MDLSSVLPRSYEKNSRDMPLLLFSIRMVMAKSGWSKRIGVCSSAGWSGASPGGMIPWRIPGVPAKVPGGCGCSIDQVTPPSRLRASRNSSGFSLSIWWNGPRSL